MKPTLRIQRRKPDFFQQPSESWIFGPVRIHVGTPAEPVHARVTLLIGELERRKCVILFTQAHVDVCDSQPRDVLCSGFFDQLTENLSSPFGLAGPGTGISEIAA